MKRLLLTAVALLISTPAWAQSVGTYVDSTTGVTQRAQGVTIVGSGGVNVVSSAGDVASGSTDSGNPVKIGGAYNTTPPTLVSGQRGDAQMDERGSVRVRVTGSFMTPGDAVPNGSFVGFSDRSDTNSAAFISTRVLPFGGFVFNGTAWDRQRGDVNGLVTQPALSSTFWNYAAGAGGITNTTTAVTVKTAAGASIRNYVLSAQCMSDALGAATELVIRDGAAGTVMWRGKIATSGWLTPVDFNFNPPLKGTANTLVEIATLTASVTGGVYCNLQGFTGN